MLGRTVTKLLVAVAVRSEVSLAVREQLPTERMVSELKVAKPLFAFTTLDPPRTHEDEMVMESPKFVVALAFTPSSTTTANVAIDTPAVAVLGSWVAKASLTAWAADVGEAATNSRPAATSVDDRTRVNTFERTESTSEYLCPR